MVICKVYRGQMFKESGKTKFILNQQVEEGRIDYFDEKEFELLIKKNAKHLGYSIDALDEDGNIYWSNYQDVSLIEKIKKTPNELQLLKDKYETLSGVKAKPVWGIKKLTDEVNKLTK